MNRTDCCSCNGVMLLFAFITSILALAAGVLLFIFFQIPLVIIGLFVALGTAVILLIALLIAIPYFYTSQAVSCCLVPLLKSFVIGIIGTIASTALALSTVLCPFSITAIVAIGLSTFFFTFMILTFVILLFQVANCSCVSSC